MMQVPSWRRGLIVFWLACLCAAAFLLLSSAPFFGTAQGAENTRPGWEMLDPGSEWRQEWDQSTMTPMHRHRMQRHWIFMNGNIPARYQGLKNPHGNSDEAIDKGQPLYTKHCASCHGDEGFGEGKAGFDLNPSPALLAFVVQTPIAVDSYLMWSIAEGGTDLNSGMPAFKSTLSENEIWQIVSYIRNGFAPP